MNRVDHEPRHDAADRARHARRDRRRSTTAQLSWGAATDNVGVVRYNVHRSTTPASRPSAANRIAQPTGTSYTDAGLAAGTYYYKVTAEDARRQRRRRLERGDRDRRRHRTAPRAPGTLTATGAVGKATLTWGAATDNVGVVALQRPPRRRPRASRPSRREPDRPADRHELRRRRSRPGTYFYRVTAEDAAGNVGAGVERGDARRHDGHDRAERARPASAATGRRQHRQPHLDGVDRQRRRHAVQRPPRHERRLHAERREPDRAADRDDLRRQRARGRHLLLQGHRRGRRRQRQRVVERGDRDRRRRDAAERAQQPRRDRRRHARSTSAWTRRDRQRRRRRATTSTAATTRGFTPSAANRIAQPTGTTLHRRRPRAGTYFYKVTAEDAAGNVGPVSNTGQRDVADTTAPSAPTGL